MCFFFQAEDGIRDWSVTGVQTCALPIWDGGVAPRGDDPRQPLLLQFSGGTTGAPKVVVFTHEQYLTNMLVGATEIGATAADRVVSSRPWPTVPAVRNLVRILSIGGVFINAAF